MKGGGEDRKGKHGAKREVGVETILHLFFFFSLWNFSFVCAIRFFFRFFFARTGRRRKRGGRNGKTIDLALNGHKTNLGLSRSSSRLSSPNEKRDKFGGEGARGEMLGQQNNRQNRIILFFSCMGRAILESASLGGGG